MKVYLQKNKVSIVGKPWQVKYILNKYMQEFNTVKEWLDFQSNSDSPRLKRIK